MATRADSPYVPCPLPDLDVKVWREELPRLLKALQWWNKRAPRGKDWLPRLVGRLFHARLQNCCLRTKHGTLMAMEPACLDVYVHMLNHRRTGSEEVLDTCRACLSSGQVFYDVGANVGYISIELARIFGGQVAVVSFEPQPLLAQNIAASAALNALRNVTVFDLMISDRAGEANLYLGSHAIHASAVPRTSGAKPMRRRTATIDEMVETGAIPAPDVMKLDVEGGELAALRGAAKTIAEHRPHIVFESDENMQRFGHTRRDLVNAIRAAGAYDFYCIRGLKADLVELDQASMSPEYTDILAKPG
jgi:FkbM family methyltransferase